MYRKGFTTGLVVVMAVMCGACSHAQQSSPRVGAVGGSSPGEVDVRDGNAPESGHGAGAGDGPVRLWRWTAPAGASVGLPVTDSAGIAFTYGHQRLVMLDLGGAARWEAERVGLREVAPLLTPDLVVAATDEGVVAFDRSSGTIRWDTPLGERANTPVLAEGRPVVSTWEGSLVALDPTGGEVVWRVPLPAGALGPAAVASRRMAPSDPAGAVPPRGPAVVVATWESEDEESAGAVGVDAASGASLWEKPLEGGGVSSPGVVGGDVVIVAGDLAAHGLDATGGQERWREVTTGAGSPEIPPLALGDGTVLVADRSAGMMVADSATGSVHWRIELDATAVRGAPTGPGPAGRYALGLFDGNVMVAGPTDDYVMAMPSPVSGVALGSGGELIVSTAGGEPNFVQAYSRW